METDLKKISKKLKTQNNRMTKDPLFCVFEKEIIWGVDPEYHSDADFKWINDEGEIIEIEDEKSDKIFFIEKERFVNAHFTETAAQKYIDMNAHNLRKAHIYAISMYRCEEMILIRKFLMCIDK